MTTGKANGFGNFAGFVFRMGNTVIRLPQTKAFHQFLEPVAIFRQVNGVWLGAKDGYIFPFQRLGQVSTGSVPPIAR